MKKCKHYKETDSGTIDSINPFSGVCAECNKQVIEDAMIYGVGFLDDGKRVDPRKIYKRPTLWERFKGMLRKFREWLEVRK